MDEIIYLNGKLIPRSKAKISVLDYGFLFGYGLYETVHTYNGKAFRLDNHLARLKFSGDRLGILIHTALIHEAVNGVIKTNNFQQARIRIAVSLGEGTITPNLVSCTKPTIAVMATEYKPPTAEKYKNGFKVIVSNIRRNSRSPVTYLKSANAMENMLARQEAKKTGADEALFLNEKGYLTEAAGSNIFLVNGGILKTPRYETGILPGVTRVVIFELAAQLGIKVKEVNIKPSELMESKEAFVTNSMIEIVPVTKVGDKKIGDGKPGEITKQLASAYKRLVKKETRL